MSATNPPNPPPPQRPPPPLPGYPAQEGRSVSFFVALFLALLLIVSVGVNVVVLLFSAIGGTAGLADFESESSDVGYQVVRVGGAKSSKERILRINVEGAISEGASPMMGAAGGTVTQIRRQLSFAARKKSIKGVLLRINSPGGGVTDSDEIHRLITEFRTEHKKPVVAYFGDMSASGGYYIAAACDRITCRPTTITGSIGVIMSGFNFAEAMEKVGVDTTTIISEHTPYKDIMSSTRKMTPEERGIMKSIVEEMYNRFVDIVDAGRPKLTREQVMQLANGQIYSAGQAKANGLVDAILQPDEALALTEELSGTDGAELVEHRRLPTFVDVLLGGPMAGAQPRTPTLNQTAARYLNQTTGAKLLYFWPGGR